MFGETDHIIGVGYVLLYHGVENATFCLVVVGDVLSCLFSFICFSQRYVSL